MYNEKTLPTEHGTLTPWIFSCLGGMCPDCSIVDRRLSKWLAEELGCESIVDQNKNTVCGNAARNVVRHGILISEETNGMFLRN